MNAAAEAVLNQMRLTQRTIDDLRGRYEAATDKISKDIFGQSVTEWSNEMNKLVAQLLEVTK